MLSEERVERTVRTVFGIPGGRLRPAHGGARRPRRHGRPRATRAEHDVPARGEPGDADTPGAIGPWFLRGPFTPPQARYRGCAHALGFESAFDDVLPTGARVTYVDTQPSLPGMHELVERTPDQLASYGRIHAASIGWDGVTEPLREG